MSEMNRDKEAIARELRRFLLEKARPEAAKLGLVYVEIDEPDPTKKAHVQAYRQDADATYYIGLSSHRKLTDEECERAVALEILYLGLGADFVEDGILTDRKINSFGTSSGFDLDSAVQIILELDLATREELAQFNEVINWKSVDMEDLDA